MTKNIHAIQLEQVRLSYSGTAVIETASCTIRKNAVTAVVGPSGSGKSTLLRTLCRMNDRLSGFKVEGSVMVLGRDIHDPALNVYELRKQVGMVFQKPCVFPQSIAENAIFGLKFHASQNGKGFSERSEQALRDVFLWDEVKDRLDDPAHTLSQGQQQRLAMARTLAVDPEILLMDEPTSALDPKSSRAIEDLILTLKDRHTIVLVTHNVDQAERVAEDLICVDDKTVCHKPCQRPLPGEGTG
jgi:phosphate transport system ATP-binding protein